MWFQFAGRETGTCVQTVGSGPGVRRVPVPESAGNPANRLIIVFALIAGEDPAYYIT